MPEILIESLSKSYAHGKQKVVALADVSFGVEAGEIFGLIGPDGAGKTTLFRIIATLLHPEQGRVEVCGWDSVADYKKIRPIIGYMPGRFSLYPDLSVEENLSFFAQVFQTSIAENYRMIAPIYEQIAPFKDRRAGALSGGMKQKLALCCALIHKPRLLLLDEPTTGVDPISRQEFWEMLQLLKNEGVTIVVSTPYMDEAQLCDRMLFLLDGKVLSLRREAELRQDYGKRLWAFRSAQMPKLLRHLREKASVESCFAFGDALHVSFVADDFALDLLRLELQEQGFADLTIENIAPSIEDCFIRLSREKK